MSDDYNFPDIDFSPKELEYEFEGHNSAKNITREFDRSLGLGGLNDVEDVSDLVLRSWTKLLSTEEGVEIAGNVFLGADRFLDGTLISEFLPDFIDWLTKADSGQGYNSNWKKPNFRPAWSGVTVWENSNWVPSGVGSATVFSKTNAPQILLSLKTGYRERIVSAQHSIADVIIHYAEKAGVELPKGDIARQLVTSLNASELKPLEYSNNAQRTIEVILADELATAIPRYETHV